MEAVITVTRGVRETTSHVQPLRQLSDVTSDVVPTEYGKSS